MALTNGAPTPQDLKIELRRADGGYEAVVHWAEGPPTTSRLELPDELSEVDEALASVGRGKRRRPRQAVQGGSFDPVRELGERLFVSLVGGELGPRYYRAVTQITAGGGQLRLLLLMADPVLANIPWELLYDPRRQDFVALSVRTPLARRWCAADGDAGAAGPMPTLEGPLRLLVVDATGGASPAGLEIDALSKVAGDTLQIANIVRTTDAPRALDAIAAGTEPLLYFVSAETEGPRRGDGPSLGCGAAGALAVDDLFGALRARQGAERPPLRFAFWSGCDTHEFAARAAPALAASAGVRDALTGDAAGAFVNGLYRAIAEGRSLRGAFTEARRRVDRELPGNREWALPVLYAQRAAGLGARAQKSAQVLATGLGPESYRVRLAQARLEMHRRNAEALRRALDEAKPERPGHLVEQAREADRLAREAERQLEEAQA
ncbi:MAG TPA: hypothetical protein VFS43_05675 [Polyangiaceae bacterium]|nr:hypothetical protein [Polyangiaceae bacterium]